MAGLGASTLPQHPSSFSPTAQLTSCRVSLREDGEVNDTGGEVEGCLLAIVDHGDAVAVPITGTWHTALEDGEGQPAGTGERWVGLRTTPNSLVQAGLAAGSAASVCGKGWREVGGPQSLKGDRSPGWLEGAE